MHPDFRLARIASRKAMHWNMKIRAILQSGRTCSGRVFVSAAAIALLVLGCRRQIPSSAGSEGQPAAKTLPLALVEQPGACEMVLVPQASDGRIEREIARVQERIRAGREEFQSIERLGWLYVAKARESFDPGYYKLAEQCALCLQSRQPQAPEALLLRGHVLQNLHRFKEAEPLARKLASRRGLSFDYGLLGDVLMEQGRLVEAAEAYQKMVDQRPDLESYARIAHLRWLKGDLAGATEVMGLATSAASPRAPEPAAWVNTRLALLKFQAGSIEEARRSCDVALEFQPNYAPALLLKGRMLLAEGQVEGPLNEQKKLQEAIETLERAARLNPLPEYLWVLSEALCAAGRDADAKAVEGQLNKEGAVNDPRTFSLFLSTRAESVSRALELAQNELNTRQDVFTHDALGWALSANGKHAEAIKEMDQALAQGTKDARLFFHAAVISARAGQKDAARGWSEKATPMSRLLLPSERKQLANAVAEQGGPDIRPPALRLAETTLFTP
jgi:tetratricopeptide (TPR) repeat protein